MSLAELGFEMPWLGLSPWLALVPSVVVWDSLWELGETLVIQ
jgi:hypothetical protein